MSEPEGVSRNKMRAHYVLCSWKHWIQYYSKPVSRTFNATHNDFLVFRYAFGSAALRARLERKRRLALEEA
jgi:hypothetical protein